MNEIDIPDIKNITLKVIADIATNKLKATKLKHQTFRGMGVSLHQYQAKALLKKAEEEFIKGILKKSNLGGYLRHQLKKESECSDSTRKILARFYEREVLGPKERTDVPCSDQDVESDRRCRSQGQDQCTDRLL